MHPYKLAKTCVQGEETGNVDAVMDGPNRQFLKGTYFNDDGTKKEKLGQNICSLGTN